MEVRAHDVPFALEHGQKIAKLEFERMAGRPEQLYGSGSVGSYYQDQYLGDQPPLHPAAAGLPSAGRSPRLRRTATALEKVSRDREGTERAPCGHPRA